MHIYESSWQASHLRIANIFFQLTKIFTKNRFCTVFYSYSAINGKYLTKYCQTGDFYKKALKAGYFFLQAKLIFCFSQIDIFFQACSCKCTPVSC